jgi:lysophospholipase L1-like esterase
VGTAPVRLVAGVTCAAATAAPGLCLEPGPSGAATGAALFWGAQLEAGSTFSTAYIATADRSATRATEKVTIASPEAGLLSTGVAVLHPDGSPRELGTLLSTSDATTGARLAVVGGTLRLAWAGQVLDHELHVAPGQATPTTVGWAVGGGQACLYWNGIRSCGAISGLPTPAAETVLGGDTTGGAALLNGALRRLDLGVAPGVSLNPTALLALGDSLTASNPQFCATPWPTLLADGLGAPWVASNGGVNALRTQHILARWRTVYAGNGHGVVAVMGGTNDLTNNDPPATTFANLQAIYDEARAAGKRVIPMTVPPSSRFAAKLASWRALNDLIRGYCAANGIPCADVAAVLDPGTGALAPAYDSGDHLHYNQAGCDAVAGVVLGALR